MEDNIFTEFECEECGKKVKLITVYEVLVKKCFKCWMKEQKER